MSLILGIETSCDETAAAVVLDGRVVLSNVVASQHDLHEKYGGVVPEIAGRAHIERITAVLQEALAAANTSLGDLDAVAVGNRPGLIGSLLIGVSAAKALAWSLGVPLIGVDHVQAHLYASSLQPSPDAAPPPDAERYPALGLVVSGGHSSLFHVDSPLTMRVIGRTIDDAVGEAYDKAAVILDAGYPGGPRLDKLARSGDAKAVDPLPRSLLGRESLDFSFSGLKTALLYRVRGFPKGKGAEARFERSAADLSETEKANLAAAFQAAAVDTLIRKIERALDAGEGQYQRVIIGGGVSANSLLRARMIELGTRKDLPVSMPPMALCVDNAAMIAGLGYHLHIAGRHDSLELHAIATTGVA